jgi:O-antigen ligase/tetratricopeptide (TPR) repeat protein
VLIEGGLLALVCLSPWAFGAVDPVYEAALYGGLALLGLLWAARLLLEGHLVLRRCPLLLCVAGLFLLAAVQLAPLPASVLGRLSPGTAELDARLLPAEPEELPAGAAPRAAAPAGRSLSLYPEATRRQALQLLAALLALALAANNVPAGPGLRRLAIAALANGALLSVLGLLQALTSPAGTIYWSEKTRGTVFGPFICRNHFAFYVNLCICLSLGLLLSRLASRGREKRRGRDAAGAGVAQLLHDPAALWISLSLAVMVTAVVFCLSRGGFLAIVAGGAVCLLLGPARSSRPLSRGAVLVPVAVTLALLAWFGLERVQNRLGSLWGEQAFRDDRVFLLPRCLPLVESFPLLGTGFGTFNYVEPMTRVDARDAGTSYIHAHNDYLEALVEGGVVRLALSLLAIAIVYWRGWRACRRYADRPEGALAVGALAAFTTVVVHSALDFGLHIPAIALLLAVLCAHLSGLGAPVPTSAALAEPDGDPGSYSLRLGGLAPVAGAVVLVVLGLLLSAEGVRAERSHRLEVAALHLQGSPDPSAPRRRIEYLEAAARLDPTNARLLAHLAQAHGDVFEAQLKRLEEGGEVVRATQTVLGSVPGCLSVPSACSAATLPCAWLLDLGTREARVDHLARRLARRHREQALRRYLEARDCCPVLSRPHLWIGAFRAGLARAESGVAYLERAKLLDPGDPEVWYRCGFLELQVPDPATAWQSWRRSLELSDRYLPEILARARKHLPPPTILSTILPDRPGVLLRAAKTLYPAPEDTDEGRPFLEKALIMLGQQPALSAEEYEEKARAHAALQQPEAALAAYQAALDRRPEAADWRYAYARLLFKQGQLHEARREVRTILDLRPQDGPARELFGEVSRELARGTASGRKE